MKAEITLLESVSPSPVSELPEKKAFFILVFLGGVFQKLLQTVFGILFIILQF